MLSKKLRLLRERQNLTQKQIADILNIDRSTYSYYEIGKSYPTLDTLMKLAQIFRVSIDEMLGYEVKPAVPTPHFADNIPAYNRPREADNTSELSQLTSDEQNIIIAYRILSENQKREIRKAVEDAIRKSNEL